MALFHGVVVAARNLKYLRRMSRYGIVNPVWTLRAAAKAKLPLALACAFLDQETGGGRNIFGHDPTIFAGAGVVTKAKYRAYHQQRVFSGNRLMQGVGPMQLTWWSTQDEADKAGGCWKVYCNMLVGFRHAAALIREKGTHAGIAAYNGSGVAAERYADSVLHFEALWVARFK